MQLAIYKSRRLFLQLRLCCHIRKKDHFKTYHASKLREKSQCLPETLSTLGRLKKKKTLNHYTLNPLHTPQFNPKKKINCTQRKEKMNSLCSQRTKWKNKTSCFLLPIFYSATPKEKQCIYSDPNVIS